MAGALEGVPDQAREALEDAGRVIGSIGAPEKVEVPDVMGLMQGAAKERLADNGFESSVRLRESSEADAGRVLEQSVPGGKRVEEGSTILLAVGAGPRSARASARVSAQAPDLVGLSYPEAEAAIKEAGLTLGGVKETSRETVSAGRIVEQDPATGTRMEPGAEVYLTTSVGLVEEVSVPDVSYASEEKAAMILTEAGCTVAGTRTEPSPRPAGMVIGTEPSAGSVVQTGAAVTIVLSGGLNSGGVAQASGAPESSSSATATSSASAQPSSSSASASATPEAQSKPSSSYASAASSASATPEARDYGSSFASAQPSSDPSSGSASASSSASATP